MKETTLACLREGEAARVLSVRGEGGMARRLRELGFLAGAPVRCLFRSPLGDPTAYLVRGAVIALRREDGGRVLVAREPEGRDAPWD